MFVLTRISRDQLFLFRVIARAEQTDHLMKASMSQSHVTTAAQRKSCRFAAVTKERSLQRKGKEVQGCPTVLLQPFCQVPTLLLQYSSCKRWYFQYLNIPVNLRKEFSFNCECPLVFMALHSVFNAKSV